jgi:hypothetical protein
MNRKPIQSHRDLEVYQLNVVTSMLRLVKNFIRLTITFSVSS